MAYDWLSFWLIKKVVLLVCSERVAEEAEISELDLLTESNDAPKEFC